MNSLNPDEDATAEGKAKAEKAKAEKVNDRAWHAAEEVLGAMIDGYDVFLEKRKKLFWDESKFLRRSKERQVNQDAKKAPFPSGTDSSGPTVDV